MGLPLVPKSSPKDLLRAQAPKCFEGGDYQQSMMLIALVFDLKPYS